MKCQELMGALNDYIDGETRSTLCQALQEHLAECNPCRIVIDNIRQTITLYRAGVAMPLPAELHNRLRLLMRDRWSEKYSAPDCQR
jgi:predicted anti-sigma-YlaC factor YlaD